MKELLLLCGLSLTLTSNNVTIKTNIKENSANPRAAVSTDSLIFTEDGLFSDDESAITVEGISFDASTYTYTFTNVNYEATGYDSIVKITDLNKTKLINFVLAGENNLTFTGENKANTSALSVHYNASLNISGNGSLNIKSNIKANDGLSGIEFASSGFSIGGKVTVEEGVTLTAIGGEGNKGSYGIEIYGTLINNGATIIGTSGKSDPENKNSNNGHGIGVFVNFMAEDVFPGVYIQNSPKAVLKGISSGESHFSHGIRVQAEDDEYTGTFTVKAGKVIGISKGVYDSDNNRSVAIYFGLESEITLENCVIEAISEVAKPVNFNETIGYIDPDYIAFSMDQIDSKSHIGENVYINCTAPVIENGFIAFFEDSYSNFYCIEEKDEVIFMYGLEDKYPEEVEKYSVFDRAYETKYEKGIEHANFVKTPTDGNVTFVSKTSYFKTLQNQLTKKIEDYKDVTTYGTAYSDIVSEYKKKVSEATYDSTKIFTESSEKLDDISDDFFEEVEPIVTFVDAKIDATDYVNGQVNPDLEAEASLASEYANKIDEVTLDLNDTSKYASSLTTLKSEFDGKLTTIRNFALALKETVDYVNAKADSTLADEVALASEYASKINEVTLDLTNADKATNDLTTLKNEFDSKLTTIRNFATVKKEALDYVNGKPDSKLADEVALASEYASKLNAVTLDLANADKATNDLTTLKNDFDGKLSDIRCFASTLKEAVEYVNNSANQSKKKEAALASEYVSKLNEVKFDINDSATSINKLASLKEEYDAKLAELRKFPVWPFVTGGSLVLVYGVGYALWKTKKIAFMSHITFTKLYSWIDKLIAKLLKK